MKVYRIEAENFGSYEKLILDVESQGLTLIQGANGSGKSTLCDLVPWALFGRTSKEGAVSEVLSWPGHKVTKVILLLDNIIICRTRGKANNNDLYYYEADHENHIYGDFTRGKDLTDTQRLLNERLGFTYETYMAGAYYHEFSQTAQFFNATAKNRRTITEQLVDLSLATTLKLKVSEASKILSKEVPKEELTRVEAKLSATNAAFKRAADRANNWNDKRAIGSEKFERDREIDLSEARRAIQVQKSLIEVIPDVNLHPTCPTCGQHTESPELAEVNAKKRANDQATYRIEALGARIKEIKLRVNPYLSHENPHEAEASELKHEIEVLTAQHGALEDQINSINSQIEDLELLSGIIEDFRSTRITNAISGLQDTTNELLSNHFDAELRVEFTPESNDRLEVSITKDGNACTFTQLSKGQRCMLKLCFGVAVMKAVALHSAVDFREIYFDEALTGMDEDRKEQAFNLLKTVALSYDSVFVIEHSDRMKVLFDNSYSVSLVNGVSEIA